MSGNELLLELQKNEPLDNFFTPEEAEVFFTLSPEQQQRYLDACSSEENIQAYLKRPDEPQSAKNLLSDNIS
ncbi:hypothetical protein [Neisseria zalophi]|uniref:Uncharacterized protein n=1 Tax=Neisseria zalophi TaxID=640030 RepID=A0A5J6PY04_9NEIS|nr:hypothetical protein [Neisseria zalophi]QEY25792.1 hypothetical protein D0T92_04050 [Neisseria zalophi]